jgi:hypothetical protein
MEPFVQIQARLPQTLVVSVAGPDVAWMDGSRDPAADESENAVPDVVELWVRAIGAGLLGGTSAAPAHCAAAVKARPQAERGARRWIVGVDWVDWGAFRILRNLLLARELDRIAVTTLADGDMSRAREEPPLEVETTPFPHMPGNLPFAVERVDPVKASRDRSVQLLFASPVDDETCDAAVEALDLWGQLIVWGGYPVPGMDPRRSGALPDGAILYDEVTVAQTFTEAFAADDAALQAVVSYASALSARGHAISRVVLR